MTSDCSNGRRGLIGMSVPVTIGLLFYFAGVVDAAMFTQISVTGEVYTSFDGGVTQIPMVTVINNLPNGSTSAVQTDTPLFHTFQFGPGLSQGFTSSASGGARALAEFGKLHIEAFASALASPLAYGPPFVIATHPNNPRAQSALFAAFQDELVITHPTLPAGTEIDFIATLAVDSIVGGNYSSNIQLNINNVAGGTFIRSSTFQFSFGDHLVSNFMIHGRVGDRIPVAMSMVAGANALAGIIVGRELQNSFFDAFNTAGLNIDPVTPGVVLVSASGHNYLTIVPEPGTAGAVVAAGGVLFLRRRRRR